MADLNVDRRHAELVSRAHQAVTDLLEAITDLTQSPATSRPSVTSEVREAVRPMVESLRQLQESLDEFERDLREVKAGIRRIDKFTLQLFQREISRSHSSRPAMQNGAPHERRGTDPHGADRRYVRKYETIRLSLQAARDILADGEKVSMAAVARRAGLSYSQVVYAFGRTENLLQQLEQANRATDSPFAREVLAYGGTS